MEHFSKRNLLIPSKLPGHTGGIECSSFIVFSDLPPSNLTLLGHVPFGDVSSSLSKQAQFHDQLVQFSFVYYRR